MTEPDSDVGASLDGKLEAVGQGKLSALRDLYEGTSSRLFPICLRIVKNREAAEDVLHEVYIKVWNRAAGFDRSKGSAWSWLSMIARNAAIDWVRARKRRSSFDHAQYQTSRENEAALPVDEEMVTQQEARRAMGEVEQLDDSSADCVRAAFFEGLTYSEVADREGLPLGTVKSRIRRALKAMREKLRDA